MARANGNPKQRETKTKNNIKGSEYRSVQKAAIPRLFSRCILFPHFYFFCDCNWSDHCPAFRPGARPADVPRNLVDTECWSTTYATVYTEFPSTDYLSNYLRFCSLAFPHSRHLLWKSVLRSTYCILHTAAVLPKSSSIVIVYPRELRLLSQLTSPWCLRTRILLFASKIFPPLLCLELLSHFMRIFHHGH